MTAGADEIRPALLDIKQQGTGLFAGALSEIGVPQHEVPLALFMFNVGVETGQLLFIAVVLSLIAVLKKLPFTVPQGSWRLLPYGIVSVAAFWTIERVASFLPVAS